MSDAPSMDEIYSSMPLLLVMSRPFTLYTEGSLTSNARYRPSVP